MSVTYSGTQIVSDSQGSTFYGEPRFIRGDIEDEIYQYSVPRASGIGEKTAGDRIARHQLRVRYFSPTEQTVRATLTAFRTAKTYGSLVIPDDDGDGAETHQYCRLERIDWGPRQGGKSPSGTNLMVFDVVLTFLQVRVAA